MYFPLFNSIFKGVYCHNPNETTTQPQNCSLIGHENDCAHHPTPPQKLNSSLQEPQINILKYDYKARLINKLG